MTTMPPYHHPFIGAQWFDVVPRSIACPALGTTTLLHAGPPFTDAPPPAIINAAVQALLYEGIASTETDARSLLADGSIRLQPAQDHNVVTPLAQVVSASMPLLAIRQNDVVCYAPVVEGPAPALRFGSAAPECRARLRSVGEWISNTIAPLVRAKPVAIDEVIRHATANGDECHARTGAANDALIAQLDLDPQSIERMRANPAFVLTAMMAAAAAALRVHRCEIEAIGGNGIDFGVRRRGATEWQRVASGVPTGIRFTSHDGTDALPAIGDSPVIDFCGLGGQALAAAPLLAAEWAAVLPADALVRQLRDPLTGIVDPARLIATGLSPLIDLAILDAAGSSGLIGRGFYAPPTHLFASPDKESS